MRIPGYTLIAAVCETGDLWLYRATRQQDGQPVLLKVPAPNRQTPLVLARLEHEFQLARDLDPGRIVRPVALEHPAGIPILILDHGPTHTLAARLGSPMDVRAFLQIAIRMSGAVAELHRHELVHKDIKPEHVLLDGADHVWLTGLGIASRLPRERQAPQPSEIIDGTLAYMAPEQTGRMNRSVDSRSDLYSVGITFYQMLTGVLPFTASDPMEWVHSQIALQALPVNKRVPGLPEPLSEMVMKLLAKNAEERYQSAAGLQADLCRCMAQWESDGRIDRFALGRQDASERLLIPEKLYGRKPEIDALFAAFDRVVVSGTPELVLLSGYPGIGKTSVVSELRRAVVPPRALFAAGKFDQYKRDIPYATLIEALQGLIRHILGRSEVEVVKWREALQEAVSPNGELIVRLLPDLGLLIGKQPAVPELPPQEATNRFEMVLRRLLGVFASPAHPLALFLDDLQWLDDATLELIEQLVTGQEVRHLLLIGAYRDNEVGPTHPLTRILAARRERGGGLEEIVIGPLAVNDVASLIADTLHCDPERAHALVQLVHEKTGGNPFFAIQFLTALADEKLLVFNRGDGRWEWDLERIRAKGYSNNVVDLMIGKLGRLPAETLDVLKQLACLGNVASIATLTTVCGQPEDTLHATLREAVRSGLVLRQEKTYAFLHDRVQEAAYALVPGTRRKELHLKIGRLLLAQHPQEAMAERVFEVADEFNRSIDIVTDADERAVLRAINTAAGRKARGAVAYASARRYLEQAMALLPPDRWNECHTESLALYQELAECEYLVGNHQRADELLTTALDRARTRLDLTSIHRLRLRLYQLSGDYSNALEAAFEALRLFGLTFPAAADEVRAATEAELRLVTENLRGRRIIDLLDVSSASDAETRVLSGLLADTVPVIFLARPDVWSLFTVKAVNICLQRGHCDESSFLYSCYAMAVAADVRSIRTAQQFSEMAIELNARTPGAGPVRGKTLFTHSVHVHIWRHRIVTSLSLLEQAFRACLDFGDLVYGGYVTKHALWLQLESGVPLERVCEVARRYVAFAQESHNHVAYHLNRLQQQFALALQGNTRSLTDFNGNDVDEAGTVREIEQSGVLLGVAFYYIMKQISSFLDERYDEALEWAFHAASLQRHVASMVNEATHYFYHALTLAALHADAPAEQQWQYVHTIGEIRERLKCWADNCPENFANRYLLVSAEVARIDGLDLDAMRLYDQAIASARDNDFVHHQALAAETASRFYRARGFERIADGYLRDAFVCYARWGAQGKVRQLEQRYPQLREATAIVSTATFAAGATDIDILAIVRASQAISGEILLDNLLKILMRIVLEYAGAQKGYLLLVRNDELSPAAAACVENQNVVMYVLGEPGFPEVGLPASILNYVRRSRDKVLLEDATGANPYSADEYFTRQHPKSVFCFPITKQTRLVGLLYLENDLTAHAFAPGRLVALELLAAQAAISLENALVYEALRASERRYRMSQDIGHVGNWEYNVQTSQLWGSDEAKRIFGLDPALSDFSMEEVEGCIPEHERVHQALVDLIETAKPYSLEYEIQPRGSSGSRVVASIADLQRDGAGNPQVVLGVILDITERKRAEEEIRAFNQQLELRVAERTAQLEATNEELEAFSYSVSHDLRAPLRHMGGFLGLLETKTANLDEDGRRYLATISDAAHRMSALIEDLLSFARTRRQEMDRAYVDLGALVQEVVRELAPDTQGRVVEWRIGELPAVAGDRAMLRVALFNLMSNALKFTQSRVQAEIEIGCLQDQQAETVVFVRDNGVGFDMQYADKLFGVFQRLHGTHEFEGSGIGLANVRRVISRHGGRTWAEGKVDDGATFYFSLPEDHRGAVEEPMAASR